MDGQSKVQLPNIATLPSHRHHHLHRTSKKSSTICYHHQHSEPGYLSSRLLLLLDTGPKLGGLGKG